MTAPLETLRLQAMTAPHLTEGSMFHQAKTLVGAKGWQALYAGNAVNVLRSAPQKALDFFWFDLFKVHSTETVFELGNLGAPQKVPSDLEN
jgi:solute carrier family 25 (mitochondrial phosphate transporter), member 23/24/25/41